MNNAVFRIVVLFGLLAIAAGLTLFTVDEREVAIKIRLGEVVETYETPGLKWKVPLIDTIRKFPKLILEIDSPRESIFTADKRQLEVDFFVKYRIVDPIGYYTSTGGFLETARDRLDAIIRNAVVTEFGKRTLQEAISLERAVLMQDMLLVAAETSRDLGVELIDFRVKEVELVDDVKNSVFAEMREERARFATELRADGRAAAEKIRAEADREVTIIRADANKEGQEIRGDGDAQAAEIYATAFNQDPEFYAFYRSIEAYKRSIGKDGDLIVMDPDNEFFRYLNQSRTN